MDMQLPELGEGVLEAEFVEWLVAPDQEVNVGDSVAEVLTDKAAVVLPSPFSGRVVELLAKPGQMIQVGAGILRYAGKASKTPSDGGNGSHEAGKSNGKDAKPAKQTAKSSRTSRMSRAATPAQTEPATSDAARARPKAAPAVRRRARELAIDLLTVRGSGPGGRILMEDLPSGGQEVVAAVARPATMTAADAASGEQLQPGTTIPLIGVRRKIAEHMVRSKTEIPHYSFMDECDVTDLVRVRERLKPEMADQGVRLTYLAFIVKATAEALKEFPLINASLNADANEIQLHDRYDIGVAVATPRGLVVPVIKDADKRGLKEIAQSIQQLSDAARDNTIERDDLLGATFVVTSIGGIGGLISTPIINQPNVGIMGVGKIVRRPMYDDAGAIYPADLMYLSYSFDHRVVDGAVGAEFNNAIIRRLQNPMTWLIPV